MADDKRPHPVRILHLVRTRTAHHGLPTQHPHPRHRERALPVLEEVAVICGNRTDDPGFFTSCAAATGAKGCPCAHEVIAELADQTTTEETPA